ncbi:MAG: hypothetical protein M1835_004697, partial [Candelina submexicana]
MSLDNTRSLERRVTLFPGSSSSSSQKRSATEPNVDGIPAPRKIVKRILPPRIPLGINPASKCFSTSASHSSHLIKFQESSPWVKYHRFLNLDQAGSAMIAYEKCAQFPTAVLKESSVTHIGHHIPRSSHANIVLLREIFSHNDILYFVYEPMSICLADLQSTPCGTFTEYEIAAICQEILHGLHYIHKDLEITHGDLTAENILFTHKGIIKIANIGASLLKAVDVKNANQDTGAIGQIMLELMEPATAIANPGSLILERAEEWSTDAQSFLRMTAVSSAFELLN